MFIYQNKLYNIPRENHETNKYYNDKCLYIAKLNPTNESDFDKYYSYALIYCNIKHLGVNYSQNIIKQLEKITLKQTKNNIK